MPALEAFDNLSPLAGIDPGGDQFWEDVGVSVDKLHVGLVLFLPGAAHAVGARLGAHRSRQTVDERRQLLAQSFGNWCQRGVLNKLLMAF